MPLFYELCSSCHSELGGLAAPTPRLSLVQPIAISRYHATGWRFDSLFRSGGKPPSSMLLRTIFRSSRFVGYYRHRLALSSASVCLKYFCYITSALVIATVPTLICFYFARSNLVCCFTIFMRSGCRFPCLTCSGSMTIAVPISSRICFYLSSFATIFLSVFSVSFVSRILAIWSVRSFISRCFIEAMAGSVFFVISLVSAFAFVPFCCLVVLSVSFYIVGFAPVFVPVC